MANEGELAKDMEAAAAHAVGLLRKAWSVSLDFSEASVGDVEKVAASIYSFIDEAERGTEMYSRYLGAYLGQIFQRYLGGKWVWWSDESGGNVPAIRCGEMTLFPHDKVRKRLLHGPQDNLEAYYETFKALIGAQLKAGRPPLSSRRKALGPRPKESTVKVTFPKKPPKFTGDGVVFQATVDGQAFMCDIAVEAMMRHYGVSDDPTRDEIMTAFRVNREAIEQMASAAIKGAAAKPFKRVRIKYEGAQVE
jgi:Protein of unknown function (DUF1488)